MKDEDKRDEQAKPATSNARDDDFADDAQTADADPPPPPPPTDPNGGDLEGGKAPGRP